ncbi:MAG: hypothetical protein Q8R70_03045 [Methanoregula sp.]|nr:hypothetical protein [Methanoregula sp.]
MSGTESNTIITAENEDIDLGVGDEQARWNTEALVNNVSSYYPGTCWGTRVFAAATGPGDVFYLTYFDLNHYALILVRVDHGKITAERVDPEGLHARSCGVSMDINPVTGTPAVSYRARDSTPIFAYKQNGIWTTEVVDPDISEGHSTSLVYDRTGTPHLAYDDGSSFANLMYATRNPDGTWTREIADRGIGYHLGNAGKNPQLRITDSGVYIAHGDGFLYSSQRFTRKLTGENWTSVTVDRGWGETGTSSITGLTGVFPTFTMGPNGIATIIYEDALNQTLMMARGPLANDSFKTSVLRSADGIDMDGLYPALVSKDSTGLTGGHLVFTSSCNSALTYVDISPDPAILPTRERVDVHAFTSTVTSDSAGKPHIFYLDSMFATFGRIKHAWLA